MTPAARLGEVLRAGARYRMDLLVLEFVPALPRPLRFMLRVSPLRFISTSARSRGARLRLMLERLGPVFVKFGQLLSTRRDLLPLDMADELARLQDQVPPFPSDQARALVETAIGQPLTQVFARFDDVPLASASVAQVHAATLLDGREVVVKIVRPDIEPLIAADIALMRRIAALVERASPEARRLRLTAIVEDYQRTILRELDLEQEARNTAQLRRNFPESRLLYVPQVHWPLVRRNVLVQERIYGVPIGDLVTLKARGTDFALLAARGVETFFTQVFEHNFFHADMHPGNIFVDVSDPADPRYIAIDCAIIGSLTPDDQDYLARNVLAFFHRDYSEVVRLHLDSGWIPADTDPAAFERVIRAVCDPIFERPLAEISFGAFLMELFETARSFRMEVQPQLVLLQKTLLYIEGLGRSLYPALDLWATAKPFMERWMEARVGPTAALRSLALHAPVIMRELPDLPITLARSGSRIRRLERGLERQAAEIERLQAVIERAARWTWLRRILIMALLIALAVLAVSGESGGMAMTPSPEESPWTSSKH
jgi:ubiquinone biosynthesis protein